MLKPDICDLLNVRNVDELRRCVATFAEGLGFRTMNVFTVLGQAALKARRIGIFR